MPSNRFHVVTGGPGAGKTTLLDRLAARGITVMDEAGRGIIRQQVAAGGAAPWTDPALFARLMFSWVLRSFELAASHAGPVFFDRGIADTIAYLSLCGLPVPEHMTRAAREMRYGGKVFLLPWWPQIYRQYAERLQTPDEAEATARIVASTWRDFGYDLVEIPRMDLDARVGFVLAAVGEAVG